METYLRYTGQVDDEDLKDDVANTNTNTAQILKQPSVADVQSL